MNPSARKSSLVAVSLALLAGIALAAGAARADVALRLPSAATQEEIAAFESAVKKARDARIRVFSERPAQAAEPRKAPPAGAAEALDRARKAYRNLELEAARDAAAEAEAACLAGGSFDACRDLLFDAHLLAGAVAVSQGDPEAASREFLVAHAANPTRVVDPRRYPPKIVGAFNRACAEAETAPPRVIRIRVRPEGAQARVNGGSVGEGGMAEVRADRAFVEATGLGLLPRFLIVAASADAEAAPIDIVLDPAPREAAEAEARALLEAPSPVVLDGRARAFLAGLGMGTVVIVAVGADGAGFEVRVARDPDAPWIDLPPLPAAARASDGPFAAALASALGAPVAEAIAPPPPEPEDEGDPDALEDESEDETVLLDPGAGKKEEPAGKTSSVLRSPWLWISIGAVVAVVGGVIIGTQVGD